MRCGVVFCNARRPLKLVEERPQREDPMHSFIVFFSAFLMMPAKVIFKVTDPKQQFTPERLIRMGAGN